MRVVYILIALIFILGWLSFELRGKYGDVSQVLAAFAILFAIMLVAAAVGLY